MTEPAYTPIRRALEVFGVFLRLGLTSFGGPIAHLGYFRRAFVEQRRWLDDTRYAQLLALCQFLPGPASSQLGFALGLQRAGWLGGLAAFIGFTLPSALLMFAFAAWAPYLQGRIGEAVLHGLKLVAVVVVAQGVLGMWRTLAPDAPRRGMAVATAVLLLWQPHAWLQWLAVATAALAGQWLCRGVPTMPAGDTGVAYGRRTGASLLLAYVLVLVMALLVGADGSPLARTVAALARAGALVFGGGHVVLPLLKQSLVTPGLIDEGSFLAGYGAAQALPGPMFSLAAFLGAHVGGAMGAAAGLVALFLPGLLLVAGVLPWWQTLAAREGAVCMIAGINAAVVGLLAAAFWDPVWRGAVRAPLDIAIVALGLLLMMRVRWPAWAIVVYCVAAAVGAAAFT
ncbi:chromate transporter [Dyella sp. OK004]|uniref:chromate efflux transporter n=1 Tax=Dyella sp. OK004 TaxID=1855292 RepID=UPI0008E0D8E8|nr:chromate efflux transporter [Dyella sp. OK004]SFR93284.1 chromate transporter [Dyella sp. OK004]